MFKKLRNTFLMTNMAILAPLFIACFTVIYVFVNMNVHKTVSERLDMEINMTTRDRGGSRDAAELSKPDDAPGGKKPPESNNQPPDGGVEPPKDGEKPPEKPQGDVSQNTDAQSTEVPVSSPAVSDAQSTEVPVSSPAATSDTNTHFSPSFSILTDENGNITQVNISSGMSYDFYEDKIGEIIKSKTGVIKYDDTDGSTARWNYRAKKTDSGYVIAFTESSMEYGVLRTLLLCLILITLLSVAGVFFVSRIIANRAIAPIEKSYNKQKQFIADASHELKTPLTTINANIDVLLAHDTSTIAEERKWLVYIKDEATRMSKLTNDLLYLARADYDEENIIFGSVSLTDALKNVLLSMEARMFESGQVLNSDIEEDINVSGAESQIKQLVLILLDNALKYTPKCGKIDVSLKKDGTTAVLTVRNDGDGISDADMEHIFDRFYRSDKARTHTEKSGFGLGLAIAQTICRNMKGSISVSSNLGEYTEFKVKLPIEK